MMNRQIACADVVLLNKSDIASPSALSSLEGSVRTVNPTARIHQTTKGAMDLSHILDLKAYASQPQFTEDAHVHDEHCAHGVEDVGSLTIPLGILEPERRAQLDAWLRCVLWENRIPGSTEAKLEVLRCKGLWWTTDHKEVVLQGVRTLYEMLESDVPRGQEERQGKIVLIGRGLDESVSQSLRDAMQSDN